MRLLVLILSSVLGLFWTQKHTQASCYINAIRTCKAQYTAARKTCKDSYNAAKPICKTQRKEQIKRCAAQKKQTRCERKKMAPQDVAACQQKKSVALATCIKPHEDPRCSNALKSCKQNCMRTCRVCTVEGVRPCVEACEETQKTCKQRTEDRFIQCQRKASFQERICKDQFALQAYKDYYNCSRDRSIVSLQCQQQAWHQANTCYHQASDAYRTCARNNSALYHRCTQLAKSKCSKK